MPGSKAKILGDGNCKPAAAPVNPDGIPDYLKALPRWVCWPWEWSPKKKKWDKPPTDPITRRHVDCTDPRNWLSFDAALRHYRAGRADGIGFVFSTEGAEVGVDLDDCRDVNTGELEPWAQEIVAAIDSYSEVSPSQTGIKVFLLGKNRSGRNRKGKIEIYDQGRFFTVTGHRHAEAPATVNQRQQQLDALCRKVFPDNGKSDHHASGRTIDLDDQELIRRAGGAKNGDKFKRLWAGDVGGYQSHSEADAALCLILAFWSGKDERRMDSLFRQSGLYREKWDERRGQQTYGQRTIGDAVATCREVYTPSNGHSRPETSQADSPLAGYGFRNYFLEEVASGETTKLVRIGFPVRTLDKCLRKLTAGWPKCASGMLFTQGLNHSPEWMKLAAETFAWIGGQLTPSKKNKLQWAKGVDKVSEAQFHAFLLQNSDRFEAVEQIPHHPPIAGHYYMHPPMQGGSGSAFRELLQRFEPSTAADYDLIAAAWITPFAGIEPGQRPAFLIQAQDDDAHGGRGAGKTTLVKGIGRLCGGHVEMRTTDDWDRLVTRLLSPAALTKRIALLDNVKTLRFSWAELEAGITGNVISGRQLYVGEGRRPNTLTYFITLNGANLSKDMAQRCVPIILNRPKYDAVWEEQTIKLIEGRRWEIIGDIIAILKAVTEPLKRFSRWSPWEHTVLARVGDPAECQRVIEERQAMVDDDQSEADMVREGIRDELSSRGHDPDTEVVWIPSADAAQIVNRIENEERRPYNRAMTHLYMLGIQEVRKSNRGQGKGCVWTGLGSEPNTPAKKIHDWRR